MHLESESRITFAVSNSSAGSTVENISWSCPRRHYDESGQDDSETRKAPDRFPLVGEEEGMWKLFMPPIFFKSETRITPSDLPCYHLTGRQDIIDANSQWHG